MNTATTVSSSDVFGKFTETSAGPNDDYILRTNLSHEQDIESIEGVADSEFNTNLSRSTDWQSTKVDRPASLSRESIVKKLLSADRPVLPTEIRVSGLEKWEGRVLEVDDDLFTAELVPSAPNLPTIIGDFDAAQLGEDRQVEVGDVVYVTVRTVLGHGGYPHRTQAVRLRRLGLWTQAEIDDQHTRAAEAHAVAKSLIDLE